MTTLSGAARLRRRRWPAFEKSRATNKRLCAFTNTWLDPASGYDINIPAEHFAQLHQ
jgi:hypothetical protein